MFEPEFPGCKYLFVAAVFSWQDILRNMSQKLSDREALKRPFRRKDGGGFLTRVAVSFTLGCLGLLEVIGRTWIWDVLGILLC